MDFQEEDRLLIEKTLLAQEFTNYQANLGIIFQRKL
jgi:hypothetical protein